MTEFELNYGLEVSTETWQDILNKYTPKQVTDYKDLTLRELQNVYAKTHERYLERLMTFDINFSEGYYSGHTVNDVWVEGFELYFIENGLEYESNYKKFKASYNMSKYIKFVKDIIPILDSVYGDNYDIQFNQLLKVIIKFPHFTITNSRDESRDIENLYVVLQFDEDEDDSDSIIMSDFKGFRSTYSFNDFMNGYCHSHTNKRTTDRLFTALKFCTGATGFTTILQDLSEDFNLERFELFLYEVDNYVRWESIEGTPYVYLNTSDNVNLQGHRRQTVSELDKLNTLSKFLETSTFIPKISTSFDGGSIKITITNIEEFMKEVGKVSQFKGSYTNGTLDYLSNVNPELIQQNLNNARYGITINTFRNEEIKYEIKTQESDNEEIWPHPEIFKYINTEICARIEERIFRKQFPSVSFPQHLEQDLVLV